ncbi:hypothetical protein [Hydrogenophaga sp.]|uniref:hypothetical protein n=1 Tax=Hydrogenophaga sp. TaxID=1904254 RepID=UPI003D0CDDAD
MSFRPYQTKVLPREFRYPAELAVATDGDDLYPWVFIDPESAVGQLAWKVRTSDGRNLVPFASVEDDRKDIACFDGDDTSGSPAVLMLVVDGSGRQYSFKNFAAWMKAAADDAYAWRRDFGALR